MRHTGASPPGQGPEQKSNKTVYTFLEIMSWDEIQEVPAVHSLPQCILYHSAFSGHELFQNHLVDLCVLWAIPMPWLGVQ